MIKFEVVKDEFRKHPDKKIKLPERKTSLSAGYDFVVPEDVIVPAKGSVLVWTDIKAQMDEDMYLAMHIRSSLGIKKNITLKNITGIIDADYFSNVDNDGNIGLCLSNDSDVDVSIQEVDAVAQGIFNLYFMTDNDITEFDRLGGIGSTTK